MRAGSGPNRFPPLFPPQRRACSVSQDPFREIFETASVRRQLHDGELLYTRGEPSALCFLVESGQLESSLPNQQARRYPRLIGVGEIVGAVDMVLDRPYSRQVEARAASVVLLLPREVLLGQLHKAGPLMLGVMQSLARNIDKLARGGCT